MAIALVSKLKAKGPLKVPYWGWALAGGAALYLGYRWWSTRQDSQADGSTYDTSGGVPAFQGAGSGAGGLDTGVGAIVPPLPFVEAPPPGVVTASTAATGSRACPPGFHKSVLTGACVENKGHGSNGGTGTGKPPKADGRRCPPGFHSVVVRGTTTCRKNRGNKAAAARTVAPVVPTTTGSRSAARTTQSRPSNQVAVTRGSMPSARPYFKGGNYSANLIGSRPGGIGSAWGGGR